MRTVIENKESLNTSFDMGKPLYDPEKANRKVGKRSCFYDPSEAEYHNEFIKKMWNDVDDLVADNIN